MSVHTPDNHSSSAFALSFGSNIAVGEVTDLDIDKSDDGRDVDEVEDILSHVPIYEAAVYEEAAREDVGVLDTVNDSISGAGVAPNTDNSIEGESISTGPYRAPRQYVEAIRTQVTNGREEVSVVEAEPPSSPRATLTFADEAEHEAFPKPPSANPVDVTLEPTRTGAEQGKKRRRKGPRLTRVKNSKAKTNAKKINIGGPDEAGNVAGDKANKEDRPTKALTKAATREIERGDTPRKVEGATMKGNEKGRDVERPTSEDVPTGSKRQRDSEAHEVGVEGSSFPVDEPVRRTRRRLEAPTRVRRRTPEPPTEELNVRQLRWARIQLPPIEPPKERGVKREASHLEDEGNEPTRKRSKSVEVEVEEEVPSVPDPSIVSSAPISAPEVNAGVEGVVTDDDDIPHEMDKSAADDAQLNTDQTELAETIGETLTEQDQSVPATPPVAHSPSPASEIKEEEDKAEANVSGEDGHRQVRFRTPPRRSIAGSLAKKKKPIDLTGDSDDESWKVGLSPPGIIKMRKQIFDPYKLQLRKRTLPPLDPSRFNRPRPPPFNRSAAPSPSAPRSMDRRESVMWAPKPSCIIETRKRRY